MSNLTCADTSVWYNCLNIKLFVDGWDICGKLFLITGWLYALRMSAEESSVCDILCSFYSCLERP